MILMDGKQMQTLIFTGIFWLLISATGSEPMLPTQRIIHNSGSYWRAGVDVNFLLKDPERNMFFYRLSLRTIAIFRRPHDQCRMIRCGGTITPKLFINTNVTGRWLELTTGIRVKIWQALWMGYTPPVLNSD
jgi:hypothetical protein